MTVTDLRPVVPMTARRTAVLPNPDRPPVAALKPVQRWPWVVAAALAGAGAVVLIGYLAVSANVAVDAAESQGHPGDAQLLALVEGIQNLVVLVIGTVLGVGALKRIAAARAAAVRNRLEADRQCAAAGRAHEVATRNGELADARGRDLDVVREVLRDVVAHAEYRTCDNSRFVSDLQACDVPADPADPGRYRHLLVRSDSFSRVDPELARLADRARGMLEEIRRDAEEPRPSAAS